MPKRTKSKNKNPPALHVIVTVSGGVADLLYKPPGIAVTLFDYDVDGVDERDPNISKDPDGHKCCVREWDPSSEVAGCEKWPVIRKASQGVYCRTWKCPDCGRTIDCSYDDLAQTGSPVCTDCDVEMEMI